jgi:MOSC domain-containing protein YiiM
MGEIVSIVYKPQQVDFTPPNHYARVPLEKALLVERYGIQGDRKGGHPLRQLNIMAQESLDRLCAEGFCVEPGQMGEQIVLRGVDVDDLQVGDQLRLGSSSVIEVTEKRDGCDRLERIQGYSLAQAAGRLGIMAKVITGGQIFVGDTVIVEKRVANRV